MSEPLAKKDKTGSYEEFQALRAEILVRIQLRSQLLALAVTTFGAIIALTTNTTFPKEVLFIYPLMALFIALEWTYHDLRILDMGTYIKQELEPSLAGLGWQHYLDKTRQDRTLRYSAFAAGGVFVGSSLLTMLIGLGEYKSLYAKYRFGLWAIIAVNVLAIICSAISISRRRVNKSLYKS